MRARNSETLGLRQEKQAENPICTCLYINIYLFKFVINHYFIYNIIVWHSDANRLHLIVVTLARCFSEPLWYQLWSGATANTIFKSNTRYIFHEYYPDSWSSAEQPPPKSSYTAFSLVSSTEIIMSTGILPHLRGVAFVLSVLDFVPSYLSIFVLANSVCSHDLSQGFQ